MSDTETIRDAHLIVALRSELEAERQASEARAVTLDGIREALGTTAAGRGLVEAVEALQERKNKYVNDLLALRNGLHIELNADGNLNDRELIDLLRERLRAAASHGTLQPVAESLYAGSPAADGRAVQLLLDRHGYPLSEFGPVVRVQRLLDLQGVDLPEGER